MRWTTPAKTISQAMRALTATAAISGAATANMPKQISETPQRMVKVEARRTRSEEFWAIDTSSTDRASLPQPIRGCNSRWQPAVIQMKSSVQQGVTSGEQRQLRAGRTAKILGGISESSQLRIFLHERWRRGHSFARDHGLQLQRIDAGLT